MNFFMQKSVAANNFEIALLLIALFYTCAVICVFYCLYRTQKRCNNLLLSIAHYRALLGNNRDVIGIIIFNPMPYFEYINPSIASLTGYSSEKFHPCAEFFKSLIHPDDIYLIEAYLNDTKPPIDKHICSFRLAKSDTSFIRLQAQPIYAFGQNKPCTGLYITLHKTSVHTKLLQDVSYLERLNTISQMASSVAHEIRNPMTIVKGYLQFFSEKTEFVKYKEQFDLIINELDRTNLIIKEYLALNQNKLHNPGLCKLNNIIDSLYPLLKAEANNTGKDIKICLGNIPELLLNENEIRQLILNMVRNGLEAMSDMADRTFVKISTYLENGKVVMSIQDQGPGISPDILADIGKPFLSTKEQGTGLGLMVCYQIADNHNAQIKINTTRDGTDFFVKFFPAEPFEQSKTA